MAGAKLEDHESDAAVKAARRQNAESRFGNGHSTSGEFG